MVSESSLRKLYHYSRLLHLFKHFDLFQNFSGARKNRFRRGVRLSKLARPLFPGGVETAGGGSTAAAETAKFLADGAEVIYNACFTASGLTVYADLVLQSEGVLNILQVKAAARVSFSHMQDAAIQLHVARDAGYEVEGFSIIFLNTGYLKAGELEPQQLFSISTITDSLEAAAAITTARIEQAREVLQKENKKIAALAAADFDFSKYCKKNLSASSIFNLSGLSKEQAFELFERGIRTFAHIPHDFPLSAFQRLQVQSVTVNEAIADHEKLLEYFKDEATPVCYFDVESFSPPVPLIDGTHPFQSLPFQFSLTMDDAVSEGMVFIAEPTGDPRQEFLHKLRESIPASGTIYVYGIENEKRVLRELARAFPDQSDSLSAISSRFKDLAVPFLKGYYHHPLMKGSTSLKAVHGAFSPETTFDSLEIPAGLEASLAYESLFYNRETPEKVEILEQLIRYSLLDTRAMADVRGGLLEVLDKHH